MPRQLAGQTADPAAVRREVTALYAQYPKADDGLAEELAETLCSALEAIEKDAHEKKADKRNRRAFAKHIEKCRELAPLVASPDALDACYEALDLASEAAAKKSAASLSKRRYDPALIVAIDAYHRLDAKRRLASTRDKRSRYERSFLRQHLLLLRDKILPLAPGFPEKISEAHLAELIARTSNFGRSKTDTPNL